MAHVLRGAWWAACALLLSAAAPAATLHVAQNHPAASDENPGTGDRPLKTISAAVKSLEAGDTVYVHAGVYREQVEFKASGKDWASPVVVAAWPGDEVVIKGSNVVTGWQKHEGNVWQKPDWPVNSQLVFVNGESLQQIAGEMVTYLVQDQRWRGKVGEGLGDMTPGSFYVDTKGKVLYVWLKDNGDPNAATVEVAVRPFLMVAEGEYLVIKGFRMTHSSTGNYVNWPAVRLTGSHLVFQGNEVTWADFIGFGYNGSFIDVIDSKFNYCGNSGMGGNSLVGCRLIGNETSYNNWRRWAPGWHAGGIKAIPVERQLLIHRHTALGNHADGIWVDSLDSGQVTISNCLSANNEGNGIHFEIAQRGLIVNNVLHHNRGRGIYLSSSRETLVAHNVCYANGMSGIVSVGPDREGPAERFGEAGIIPARNNYIIGNITMDNMNPELKPETWNYRPELILPDPRERADLFGGCHADYNVYWRSDGRAIPFWFGWGAKTWDPIDRWREDTGNDKHSVIADPLFVHAAGGDFHLKPASPAAGLVPILGEVGTDADDQPRPDRGRLRCAGAYELPTAKE